MNDLKFACRQLLKNPAFTIVAVLTLALGIGANTAIFTLIDHVILRGLPVKDPQELCVVPGHFSYPDYERLRDRSEPLVRMVGTHPLLEMEISIPGRGAGPAKGELVSGSYFATLGVGAMMGRTILPDDDRAPECSPVAVISHAFWQRAFDGAPDVLGRKINVRSSAGDAGTGGLDIYDGAANRPPDGAVLTIVGIAPPEFFGDTVGVATEVWMPMMMQPAVMPGRPWLNKDNVSFITILGRLKPGLSEAQIRTALTVVWRQILTDESGGNLTEERKRYIARRTLAVEFGGKGFHEFRTLMSQPLQILMCVVGMVLLIACLNVANLLMARGTARRHELGVRLALGAGRACLIRQLLMESLLLSALGGTLGLLIAFGGTRLLVAMASGGYQAVDLPTRPDFRTLGFAAAISLLTTVLFGIGPALRATRMRVADALKDASRSTANRQRGTAGKVLVGIQVAVSVVLLIGAGLFLRSLHFLKTQDVGYNPEHLVMMRLDPVSAGYRGDDIGRVCRNLQERIRILPGVQDATFSENGLFHGPDSATLLDVEGFTPGTEWDKRAQYDQVGPGYFSGVGIPLLRGRDFSERDGPAAPRVAVINESMAKFYFPEGSPIGRHLGTRVGSQRFDLEIVGVARDVQDHSFWSKPLRRFYVSYLQPIDGITAANFAIRTTGSPPNLDALLRREVQAENRNLMVLRIRHLQSLMDQSLVQTRLITKLSSFFGLLAAALAMVGLYGVVAYEVVQRRREVGIRMALGAQRGDVLRLVIGQGMKIVLIGAVLGVLASLGLTHALESWLYEIKPTDPSILFATTILMITVALVACWLPAARASRVEPVEALRYE
jgi:predicted permease